jgi:CHAT domain-containing protein/tetratricopeptide (TPR) repeat protein
MRATIILPLPVRFGDLIMCARPPAFSWGILLAAPALLGAGEPLTPAERDRLEQEGRELNARIVPLHQAGKTAEAVVLARQLLAIREQLHAGKDHAEVAANLNALGFLLRVMGEYGQALPCLERALAMNERLFPVERYPDGHPDLATTLNNLGYLLKEMGELGQALPILAKTLAMRRRLYPAQRFPDGHPQLASSLNNLGVLLQAMGEYRKALPYLEQALAMSDGLYPAGRFPDGHPHRAVSLHTLGVLLDTMGEHGKALPCFEQALAMNQRLYPAERFPDGHPALATSLNNLGGVLKALGKPGQALPCYEKALAMVERLYPAGHPLVADAANNLGSLLEGMGEYGKALPCFEKALALNERLYPAQRFPDGHPHLALSLNNLGALLQAKREYSKALPYYEKAVAMTERLYPAGRYPDGHPELVLTLTNLGAVLQALGEHGKALPCLKRAVQMTTRQAQREIAGAPETQALALLRSQLPCQAHYLCSPPRQTHEPAGDTHALLWPGKGLLLDLLARRHQAAQADASPETSQRWQRLLEVHRQQNRLAAQPAKDPAAQQRRLTELAGQQEQLERQLAATVPELARHKHLSTLGPRDLLAQLPAGSAFIDVYRHAARVKGVFVGDRYQTFILAPGRPTRRIDLGPARPIDEAITSWRGSIQRLELGGAPGRLRELVWDPLAAVLPPGTRTVYLSADGDLARLPWAALPGKEPGSVLLEEVTLAMVPSGQWLLGQLLYPQKTNTADTLVAAGAIDYGQPPDGHKTPYASLAETDRELRRVLEAFGAANALHGAAATPAELRQRLPQARYAHIATHGYFDADAVTAEQRFLRKQLETLHLGESRSERVGLRQHPLGYVGLALAGANDPKADGILTGLGIVDLPLEKLRLCVLSACETGLGELTEGEGVVGLQRAFHVAGCANVIGSLWKVDDAATAALMAQFYHELRVNKCSPLESLRQAQLTIYRHPERIADLAGERGRPALEAAAKLGSAAMTNPGEKPKTTPTKLWAAFVLSGAGR